MPFDLNMNEPPNIDVLDWKYECETVAALLVGYEWRWQNAPLEVVASESRFELPLINPQSNKPSSIFNLAGRQDGIVQLEDGRFALLESKLVSESLESNSDYWTRLQLDQQISIYIHAARRQGHALDTVLYDVTRKPTIKPNEIPILDNLGVK